MDALLAYTVFAPWVAAGFLIRALSPSEAALHADPVVARQIADPDVAPAAA